jgi:hypothetical protein
MKGGEDGLNSNAMPKGKFTPFTREQEEYIKREYLNKPVKQLANDVNCSFGRIMRFLKKHDLEIPRSVIEKRIQDSRRQKGCVPFNKGKKQIEFMSKEAIEKTKATRFKKGNIPHNTKGANGVISIRQDSSGRFYKHIRVEKGVWELYHRFLWEKHNGSIPKDMIVAFKDQDSLNVTLDNLHLSTVLYIFSHLVLFLVYLLAVCRQYLLSLRTYKTIPKGESFPLLLTA